MVHEPSFGEAARSYPGPPTRRAPLIIAGVALAAIIGTFIRFYPHSPSPDEWATQLARTVVIDGTTYVSESGVMEAAARVRANITAWLDESGCKLVSANGFRDPKRAEVAAEVRQAVARAQGALPEGPYGVGWVVVDRSPAADFGGAVIVADCTKEQQAPLRGPFG